MTMMTATRTRTGFVAEGVVRELPLVASTNGVMIRYYCRHCGRQIAEVRSVAALKAAQPRIWEHENYCVEDVGAAVRETEAVCKALEGEDIPQANTVATTGSMPAEARV